MPTLAEVLKAFPRTPINVEIKGRTPDEATEEYVKNAEVLARLLKGTKHRKLIVVSFQQAAVDRFHELVAEDRPGARHRRRRATTCSAAARPAPGVVAFQVPITFTTGGTTLQVTTAENVAKAHRDGYAWQNWFSNEDSDAPATWRSLIDMCVDGTMTSRPVAYERVLKRHRAARLLRLSDFAHKARLRRVAPLNGGETKGVLRGRTAHGHRLGRDRAID